MAFTQAHALVIGVGSHQFAPYADVPVTVQDAKTVAETLVDPRTCGYPAAQVTLLHDDAATKKGILTALEQLAQSVQKEDTVFFFFCGHGAVGSDGNYYLVCNDAKIDNGRVVPGTGISQKDLLQYFRSIHARRLLMVYNACFSGNISPTLGPESLQGIESSSLPEETSSVLLGTGEGRIIITASRESQKSYVGKGDITIFTQALVDGLKGKGVTNSGGFISAYSLYEHIFEAVNDTVKDKFGKDQEPELTVLKGIGPFAVSLYKGATTLGDFEPEAEVPDLPAVNQVKPEKLQKLIARVEGSGTIVQGDNNTVVGAGGVMVGGNAGNINTGTQTNIDTGGGAYIGGGVKVKGDFVGRDRKGK